MELTTLLVIDWLSGIYGPEYLENLQLAVQLVINNIHWILLGTIIGMFFGIIPGMGGTVALAVMIPFTLGMDQFSAFAFLTGAVGAVNFTGSMTAILISTPGTAGNAATIIDGYPMTQNGEAERAIGASALSSGGGAIFATVIFILTIPIVIAFALLFGPGELFWLIVFALILIPVVVGNRPILGMAFAGLGALLALIGRDPIHGRLRMDFGLLHLWDGVEIIPVIIGLFAIAELIKLSATPGVSIVDETIKKGSSRWKGVKDVLERKGLWFRSALIGTAVGILPGIGSTSATFLAYAHAIQISLTPDRFGDGIIDGVIAPEAANDAKDGGQLYPTLGLGIPGSGSMAVFLGGLMMHGIVPGPNIILENVELVMLIAISLVISNITTSIIGLLATRPITKILDIPVPVLVPLLSALTLASAYVVRNSFFDMGLAVLFGLFGFILIYLNISRIPFLIAFILAGALENNAVLAWRLAGEDVVAAFFGSALQGVIIFGLVVSVVLLFVDVKSYLSKYIFRSSN